MPGEGRKVFASPSRGVESRLFQRMGRSAGRAMLRWFSWSSLTESLRWGKTSSLTTLQESELMAVAKGVGSAQLWKGGVAGHTAISLSKGSPSPEATRNPREGSLPVWLQS
jgi:hypothetical protein